jgi:hypothetical protein
MVKLELVGPKMGPGASNHQVMFGMGELLP